MTRRDWMIDFAILAVFLLITFVALIVLATETAAGRRECLQRPTDYSPHRWHTVDERKCWYRGRDRIDKQLLYWPPTPVLQGPPLPVVAHGDDFDGRWHGLPYERFTYDNLPVIEWRAW